MPTPCVQAAAEGMPASPKSDETTATFEVAFAQFESPIAALVGRVRALDFLVCWALERPQDERGNRLIAEGMLDAIFYLTDQVRKETGALEGLWTTLDKTLPMEAGR